MDDRRQSKNGKMLKYAGVSVLETEGENITRFYACFDLNKLGQQITEQGEKNMAQKLKQGDKVEWQTPQGKTRGTVKKKLTAPMKIKGHEVAASDDNPEYLVESEKSGDAAAHKPEALKKVKEGEK